jgi:hypothetical protein
VSPGRHAQRWVADDGEFIGSATLESEYLAGFAAAGQQQRRGGKHDCPFHGHIPQHFPKSRSGLIGIAFGDPPIR